MKINLKNRKQKGFTLVELLLVVGIIALGAVVAYITLPKVQSTARANAEATNINTIAAGIKNVYAGSNNFTSLGEGKVGNGVLIRAKAAPDRMVVGADGLSNGFGGDVTVEATTLGAGTVKNAYKITYSGVPNAECTKLVTGVGNNFADVKVNGVDARLFPKTEPIDPAVVAGATQCGKDGDNNVIVFSGT